MNRNDNLCCLVSPAYKCHDKYEKYQCGKWFCDTCIRKGFLDDSGTLFKDLTPPARCLPCSREFREAFYGDPDYE